MEWNGARMRQGQQNRRGRGRNRKGQNPLTRSFESTGPDVKIRGTAAHIAEKYAALARDAHSSGDLVLAENYYQHAEHYNRIIMAAQAQNPTTEQVNGQRARRPDFDQPGFGNDGEGGYENGYDDGDGDQPDTTASFEPPAFLEQPVPQPRPHAPRPHEHSRTPTEQPRPFEPGSEQPRSFEPRDPREPRQPGEHRNRHRRHRRDRPHGGYQGGEREGGQPPQPREASGSINGGFGDQPAVDIPIRRREPGEDGGTP